MSKTATRRKPKRSDHAASSDVREDMRRRLAREHKREKEIQRLARAVNREMQRSNDALQHLGIVLASRARALEAEREAEIATRG